LVKQEQLKFLLESFWDKKITKEQFLKGAKELIKDRLITYAAFVDYIPSNDFAYYDYMLDMSFMLGCIPERFKDINDELELYIAMARGTKQASACEMTKWFDTNYHYIVPEIEGHFELKKNLAKERFLEAKQLGFDTVPTLIGPFTFVFLSKMYEQNRWIKVNQTSNFTSVCKNAAKVYNTILKELQALKVPFVFIQEPALVLDFNKDF